VSVREQWTGYKLSHGKQYSAQEESLRFSLWDANRRMVEAHNAAGHGWTMALTETSDWTPEELESRMLGYKPMEGWGNATARHLQAVPGAPDHLDYREQGMVTPVKNQGMIGSAVVFSALGAIEGMWMYEKGELVDMSVQQILDCVPEFCQGGGYMDSLWEYTKDGLESAATYPGTGGCGECRYDPSRAVAHTSGYQRVDPTEEALETALYTVGYPITVAVHVGSSFQHYNGGVFSDPSCQNGAINHAMLLVGYDKTGPQPYWIVKNSWGTSWGEAGYIKMAMGENSCGIAKIPMYPVL